MLQIWWRIQTQSAISAFLHDLLNTLKRVQLSKYLRGRLLIFLAIFCNC